MKRLILFSITLTVMLGLENCKEGPTDPDTEVPTYTWKGTLYKGLGEEVWPNATLELIATERNVGGFSYKSVATGSSDENGYFEIQYDEFDASPESGEELFLEANGVELINAPYNVNVGRHIAEVDNHQFVCDISELKAKGIDSLFILIPEMIPTPGTSGYKGYRILKIAINDSTQNEISLYSGLTTRWNNAPIDYIDLWYGLSNEDFDNALENNEHNFIDVNSKGFPFTNHVKIPAE